MAAYRANPAMHQNARTGRVLYDSYTFHIRFFTMGIVKISDLMHENLRVAGNALSRSINAQAEHWMRIGMLAELHPALDHREICQLLIRAEQAGGFDMASVAAALAPPVVPSVPVPVPLPAPAPARRKPSGALA
jgi:hypothetical protein